MIVHVSEEQAAKHKLYAETMQHNVGPILRATLAKYTSVKPRGMQSSFYLYHRHEKKRALRLSRAQMASALLELEKRFKVTFGVQNVGESNMMPPPRINGPDTTLINAINYICWVLVENSIHVTHGGSVLSLESLDAVNEEKPVKEEAVKPVLYEHENFPIQTGHYSVVRYQEPCLVGYIISVKAHDAPEFYVYENEVEDESNHAYLCDNTGVATVYTMEDLEKMFEGDIREGPVTIRDTVEEPVSLALLDYISRANARDITVVLRFCEVTSEPLSNDVFEHTFEPAKKQPDMLERLKSKLTSEEYEYLISSMQEKL